MRIHNLIQSFGRWSAGSSNPFIRKIGMSMERDSSYPLLHYLRKGFILLRSTVLAKIYLRGCNRVGRNARTRGKPNIENTGRIEIGNYFHLNSKNVACDIVAMPNGRVSIGDEVFINYGTSIVAQQEVRIGDRVRIGPYCMIHDTDFHVIDDFYRIPQAQPVVIEDGVWLAAKVIILKGSLIGEGSIIGAGSVVSGIIPPHCLAAGSPARVVKWLHKEGSTGQLEEQDAEFRIVYDAVKQLVSRRFGFPEQQIASYMGPNHIPGWTAAAHVSLCEELQDMFHISINGSEMVGLTSIHKIAVTLYRRARVTASYHDK